MKIDLFTVLILFFIWTILAILARLFNLEKYGIEVYPLLIIMKSKERLKKKLYKFIEKHPKMVKIYSLLTTKLMLLLIIFSYIFLGINGYLLLANKLGVSEIVLGRFEILIPMYLNLMQLISLAIAIFLAIFPHEICHALIGLKNDMKIEEIALFSFLGLFSGGYVEFDKSEFSIEKENIPQNENKVKKEEKALIIEKLKKIKEVSAAGLGINLIILLLFIFFLLLLPTITNILYIQKGVYVVDVINGSPAEKHGIKPGMIIYAINGTKVHNVTEFIEMMRKYNNSLIILSTSDGDIAILVPSDGKIGVIISDYYAPRYKFLPNYQDMVYLITLIASIQLAVIILNAIPMFVSDGSYFLKALILEKAKSFEKAELINFILNMLGISLFILNLILSFI